jgi:hypothetical protein
MRQYTANPARYQPTTVSGFTMTTASDHRDHSRRSTTQNARSTGPISGAPGWQVLGRGYDSMLLMELGWRAAQAPAGEM